MPNLVLNTFDWVPDMPRGYVRDLRVRWALEEAGLPYRVESVSFHDRKVETFKHQPFGQVPWLTDGDISIFESGAILLHLGELSEALMPADPHSRNEGRAKAKPLCGKALRAFLMAAMHWPAVLTVYTLAAGATGRLCFRAILSMSGKKRIAHRLINEWSTEPHALPLSLRGVGSSAGRRHTQCLSGTFSITDILMADALRLVDRFDGLSIYSACQDVGVLDNRSASSLSSHFSQKDSKPGNNNAGRANDTPVRHLMPAKTLPNRQHQL